MKLIVDARMYHSSGIGEYLRNILNGLEQLEGVEIGYITSPDVPEELKNKKTYPLRAAIYSPWEQLLLPLTIPHCDIFWTPHYNVPLFWINAKKRIVTIHDVFHVTPLSELSFLKKLYAQVLIQGALWISNHIITVSEFSKNEILKYFNCNPNKIEVIKNGVRQTATWRNLNYIKIKYNLPEQYILFVGNVKPNKNIRGLLESYLLLDQEIQKKYKVVIVGRKDGFITGDSKLFSWVRSTPLLISNIVFTGYVEAQDLDSVYHYASLFVFPSLYEGFGLPPLEAMVNGCPVIASKAACMPEICGDAVLYFDPDNPKDIVDKIGRALDDSLTRGDLKSLGTEQVKKYRWETCCLKHNLLFSEIHIP